MLLPMDIAEVHVSIHCAIRLQCNALDQMIKEGKDPYCALPYLSVYLGHTDITNTEIYLRLTMERYDEVINVGHYIYERCWEEAVMTDFARLMSDYFVKYLAGQKGSGSNTMKTYRDTFVQLLEFMDEKKHIRADCIEVDSFSYDIINEFLEYLEKEKRVSISTRNNRLAAIRSFFKYTGYHEPKYLNISTSIREISKKKTEGRQMNYLSVNAMEHFLNSFDKTDHKELRCFCIVLLLYESGARVTELCNVRRYDLHLEKPYTMILHGKGDKIRSVPLDGFVADVISNYIQKYRVDDNDFLFFNTRRERLTREGVNYIVHKYFERARLKEASIYPAAISAHCLRHTKAMHLLENGVNLIYIRDLLGHTSVTTTEIYSKANPEVKRKHIEDASRIRDISLDYSKEEKEELLEWLKNSI